MVVVIDQYLQPCLIESNDFLTELRRAIFTVVMEPMPLVDELLSQVTSQFNLYKNEIYMNCANSGNNQLMFVQCYKEVLAVVTFDSRSRVLA